MARLQHQRRVIRGNVARQLLCIFLFGLGITIGTLAHAQQHPENAHTEPLPPMASVDSESSAESQASRNGSEALFAWQEDPVAELPVFALPGAVATASPTAEHLSPTEQPAAAAWAGQGYDSTHMLGPFEYKRLLVDVRGFFHKTSDDREDWFGAELLSYFDIFDGFSGAAVLRNEVRGDIGRYGTVMLIPQITSSQYLVLSTGIGDGAVFMPLTRLDMQIRGIFPYWKRLMYDVGYTAAWWPGGKFQFAQSNALIFWLQHMIIEVRDTVFVTDPGFGVPRSNFHATAVVLVGQDRDYWYVVRGNLGDEPENVPGKAFEDSQNLLTGTFAFGVRRWLTPKYGVAVELEFYGQWQTWHRIGLTLSAFFDS